VSIDAVWEWEALALQGKYEPDTLVGLHFRPKIGRMPQFPIKVVYEITLLESAE
jgi:hypothetical protein